MFMQAIRRKRCPSLVLLTLAMTAAPVWAQSPPASRSDNIQLLDILLRNGVLTQAQYDQLVAQQAHGQQAAAAQQAPATSQAKALPVIASKDRNLTMKIGGRFRLNAAAFDNDKNHNGNGQEIRRARFDISGQVYQDWNYMVSVDFASSDHIKNAYFTYTGFNNTDLILGYFKPMYSLEYQDSNKGMEFSERSLLGDSFDIDKRIGVGVLRHVTNDTSEYTAGVGVFGQTVPADTEDQGDSGYGVDARATYAFVHTDDRLLHLGGSAEWRKPGDGEGVRLATRPDLHLANQMVDTAAIDGADGYYKLGVEGATVFGPLAMEAEYMQEQVRRDHGQPGLGFSGWYMQASYFLTADSRAAAYDQGAFGNIAPNGENGAWQLAMRYDELDLTDRQIIGGRESNLSAAVNWYVNRYLRFSLNYIKVLKLDRPGSLYDGDKPGMAQASLWLAW